MVTTLHLTQAVWEAVKRDGLRVVIVDGEALVRDGAKTWTIPLDWWRRNWRAEPEIVPPAELVAASAMAEGKCETCDGHCQVFASRDIERPELDRWYQCPTCFGSGRPRVAITVDCEVCIGRFGPRYGEAGKTPQGPWGRLHDCRTCTNGKRTVGSVVIADVVPVAQYGSGHVIVGQYLLVGDMGGLYLMDNREFPVSSEDLTRWLPVLCPDGNVETLVGRFGLILEDVREGT